MGVVLGQAVQPGRCCCCPSWHPLLGGLQQQLTRADHAPAGQLPLLLGRHDYVTAQLDDYKGSSPCCWESNVTKSPATTCDYNTIMTTWKAGQLPKLAGNVNSLLVGGG